MTDRTQFFLDVMAIAIEGGIGYWARAYDIERDDDLNYLSYTLVEHNDWENYTDLDAAYDGGNVETYVIDIDSIRRVFSMLRNSDEIHGWNSDNVGRMISAYHEKDSTDIDADDADCIIQIACFNEVVYG